MAQLIKGIQQGIINYIEHFHRSLGVPVNFIYSAQPFFTVANYPTSLLFPTGMSEGEKINLTSQSYVSSTRIPLQPYFFKISATFIERVSNTSDFVNLIRASFKNNKGIFQITILKNDESTVVIGKIKIERSLSSFTYKIAVPIGIGLSHLVITKIKNKCKNTCPKYIKCLLQSDSTCEWSTLLKVIEK